MFLQWSLTELEGVDFSSKWGWNIRFRSLSHVDPDAPDEDLQRAVQNSVSKGVGVKDSFFQEAQGTDGGQASLKAEKVCWKVAESLYIDVSCPIREDGMVMQ